MDMILFRRPARNTAELTRGEVFMHERFTPDELHIIRACRVDFTSLAPSHRRVWKVDPESRCHAEVGRSPPPLR